MTRTFSSNFVSEHAALVAYKPYGCDMQDIEQKLKEGAIAIGKPVIAVGDTLIVIGGQYVIELWRD